MLIAVLGIIVLAAGATVLFINRDERTPTPQGGNTPGVSGESPRGDQWFGVGTTSDGRAFSYPDPFPGRYVRAVEWPPQVEILARDYSCVVEAPPATDGPFAVVEKHTFGGAEYCVGIRSEGAAGSTYTSYEYTTAYEGGVARISFTLRTPQCLNYDEPERSACSAEQSAFSADDFANRITRSIR